MKLSFLNSIGLLLLFTGCSKTFGGFSTKFNATDVKNYTYKCQDGMNIKVEYINRNNDSIAVLDIPNKGKRMFVNTISASGAKYASGEYTWWLKGDIAYFDYFDTHLECKEINN